MTNLESLKNNIENNSLKDDLIIFELSDIDFISNQYIQKISELKHLDIEYLDSLETVNEKSIFEENLDTLKVFKCDKLDKFNDSLIFEKNIIIVTNKVELSIKNKYNKYVYEVPKLENWQIKDYVYSIEESIEKSKLDDFIEKLNYNIYRIDNELEKLNLFPEIERPYVFDDFIETNAFNDVSKYSIFDFTNSIIKKDISTLLTIYKEKDNIDIEPLGVVTILLNSFRDIIRLQFDPRITVETSGLTKSRFWAIKYNCGFYTNKKLKDIFEFLCDIDRKLKTGFITTDIIIDYVLLNILN